MKIYIAGGMTITNVKGREREVCNMMSTWKRLFSFYFVELIHKSEILLIKKENDHSKTRTTTSPRTGKTRTGLKRTN